MWYDKKDAMNWVEVDVDFDESILHITEWMEHVPLPYMEFFLHVAREVFDEYYSLRRITDESKGEYVEEVCHRLKIGPYGDLPRPTSPYLH